jgi:hypothetical protein
MALNRVEIAIECDDIDEDAIPLLALFVEMLGLDPIRDVTAQRKPDESGTPVLLAVLQPEE